MKEVPHSLPDWALEQATLGGDWGQLLEDFGASEALESHPLQPYRCPAAVLPLFQLPAEVRLALC